MRIVNDIYYPDEDHHGVHCALEQVRDLDIAIEYCTDKRICVQAGGNCGIFPQYLSEKFKVVYTFEPENENFFCLVNNAHNTNIIKLQAALGAPNTPPLGLMYYPKNSGGHHVKDDGVIPVITIDSLNLPCLGLLQLDIEGYELFALRGAERTIIKYSPVIMIEHKKHAERYNHKPQEVIEYLSMLGYKERERVRRDIIFTKGEI